MTNGKLYGDAKNFRTQKVLVAAKLFNAEVSVAGAEAPADKFPLGVTPAYESDSALLFGAESIALHFAEAAKVSVSSEVVQWLQWAEGQLLPNVLSYVLNSVSAVQADKKTVEAVKAEFLAQLKHFNDVLVSRTFLAGERFGLADISVALNLLPAYQHVLDESARKELVNVNRWFLTVVNQPAVKEVIGDFAFIAKASTFDAAKFKELSAKAKPAPKKAEKKKEEKKDEDLDAADAAVASEPKATDPFAAMPKGTFVMDDWKRCYSNEDTEKVALPYFWKNFDAENYSIWFGEYKYPEDLSLTFMSCNLISGMFQRLEKLKKNAFASVCLFGTNNNSTISGVWVWRGHELAFPLSADWTIDYESYEWKKLDPTTEETKKLVNEYFLWEGDFGGKAFNQGKIFK